MIKLHHHIFRTRQKDKQMDRFRNREDAGKKLAQELKEYAENPNVIVLALPRGGVPVGFEVSKELRAPMDIFLVRKLGAPGHEELAMGAIAPGKSRVLNNDVVSMLGISDEQIAKIEEKELKELNRRLHAYRGDRPEPNLTGKIVLLVDDGLATGASMQVAVEAVRNADPEKIVVGIPTAASDSVNRIKKIADEVISVIIPTRFFGVGAWYDNFDQTTDDEVREILEEAASMGLAVNGK